MRVGYPCIYHGKHPYTSYPVVRGHEVSGAVVETGNGIPGLAEGGMVTIQPQVTCGKCYSCRKIKLKPLITHDFAFKDYQKAYEYIGQQKDRVMKVIIDVDKQ